MHYLSDIYNSPVRQISIIIACARWDWKAEAVITVACLKTPGDLMAELNFEPGTFLPTLLAIMLARHTNTQRNLIAPNYSATTSFNTG